MSEERSDFQYCLESLRESDRDRYLACLLVPEKARGAFAALYAFNAEIARVRDVIREAAPGEIRLQWWRDLIAGQPHGAAQASPVASALLATIERYALPRATFERYLEARTFDLYDDPMPDRAAFEGYAGETVSALIQLSAMVLDSDSAPRAAEAAGHGGVALATAGALLLMPRHRKRGQVFVPGDILAATGLDRDAFLRGDDKTRCRRALDAFEDLGREHLVKARTALAGLPPVLFPAFLPVALAGPILDRAGRAGVAVMEDGASVAQWRRQWWLWRAARRGRV